MKNIRLIVDKEATLLEYMYNNIDDSKNNIKNMLKRSVYVNNKRVSKFDYKLHINDVVSVKPYDDVIDILYEDKYLIAVNKKSGLLTVSDDNDGNTLYKEVSSYVKKSGKNNKIYIVNRLDKDTSGIVLFSKDKNLKEELQNNWNDIVSVREYTALVHGKIDDSGVIKSYLSENDSHIVYSSKVGKLAITRYKRIKYNSNYSLVCINIDTGRKNQIRVHMKEINHPIVGDRKYGTQDSAKRLMLHHNKIELYVSKLNKKLVIECPCDFNI